MKTLLAIPILLLAASLTSAVVPPAVVPPQGDPPPSPESKALNKLYELCRRRDAGALQQAYEQIAKDFPGKEVADEAAYRYAYFHFYEGHLDKAQDLFLSLKRAGRENRWASRAVLGLSEVARKRGDERAMLGYLEEAVNAKAAPTGRNRAYTLETRQEATNLLGRHYRDKGDFKKGLDYFTRWEPQNSGGNCGTCVFEMLMEREREITVCKLHLGDHASVIRDSLLELRYHAMNGFYSRILFRLYSDAGQLDDLLRLADDYDKARTPNPGEAREPTRNIRELLEVEKLAREKDVAALVALCQDEGAGGGFDARTHAFTDPIHSAGAEALGALDAVEAVLSALAKKPKLTTWLVYALGRSNSPAALEALAKLAKQQRGWSDDCIIGDVAYALALKGDPGRKVLKRLAERKQSDMGKCAGEWLDREAKPAWPEPTWPHPKAGSLPKTLPALR
jgi:hypothetical protein